MKVVTAAETRCFNYYFTKDKVQNRILFWNTNKSPKNTVELKGELLKYMKYIYTCLCVGTTMCFSYDREELMG
jgi:hypothetical protein